MPCTVTPGPFEGVFVLDPHVFADDRGYFFESYSAADLAAHGLTETFVQDNHSKSSKGVVRGLHFQRPPHAQGKLVRVVKGRVWDVAVDLRPGSATRGKWFGLELSEANRTMLYLPPGFAHGFLTLEDDTEFLYKCTAGYHKASEGGYRYDDPTFAIAWPTVDAPLVVSDKDRVLPFWDGSLLDGTLLDGTLLDGNL
jgi:dTDP-4-dehydrorhamnose 3,5-epimerase